MIFQQGFAQTWERTAHLIYIDSDTITAVRSIRVTSDGYLLAGTEQGGVFFSLDNGEDWTEYNDGLQDNITITAIEIAGNDTFVIGSDTYGLFQSLSLDEPWESTRLGLTIYGLNSGDGGLIFAGLFSGVLRSSDYGTTWSQRITSGLPDGRVRAFTVLSDERILAGTSKGIYLTLDGGITWSSRNTEIDVFALAIRSDGLVFSGTSSGVYVSPDSGETWRLRSPSSLEVWSLAINSSAQVFAGTYGQGVYRLSFDGTSWDPISNDLPTSTTVTSLAINDSGRVFVGTFSDGVFRSIDLGLPTIEHESTLTAQPESLDININATITDDRGIEKAMVFFRKGGKPTFGSQAKMFSDENNFLGVIPPEAVTSRGVDYVIVATDSFGNIKRYPTSGIQSIQVHVNDVNNENPQPAGSDTSGYRLISMPLNLDDKNPKTVFRDWLPYDPTRWRFLEPNNDGLPVEFPNTSEMSPGKAFWLIVTESGLRLNTGPGTSVRTDTVFTIPLVPGWNAIGSPFNFDIPISNIHFKSNPDTVVTLREFTGNWNNPANNPDIIEPFKGYAIFNDSMKPETLVIDPNLSSTANTQASELNFTHNDLLWSINILAQCQQARDIDNLVAITRDASSTKDEYDLPEPQVIGKYISVYFPHRDWDTLSKRFCTDFRPEFLNGEIWEFEIKTNIRDKVHLTFQGVESVPKEFEVWLVDEAVNVPRNLGEANHYSVAGSESHPKRLQLVVGKSDFVADNLTHAQNVPTDFELSQNFPNPFNPVTTIRYGLPKEARVTLKVYNILGEEVATLVNDGQKKAGYHVAIWDGRNNAGRVVASGIYVYQLRAGDFIETRKMALVR